MDLASQTHGPELRRRVIGLMSGTSADGVDAALLEVFGAGAATEWSLLGFTSRPLAPELRREILELQGPRAERVLERLARLHFRLGEIYAGACREVAAQAGLALTEVDAAGLHGQTLFHGTDRRQPGLTPATLQVGEAQVLAERTGLTVVHNFRARDVAAGGTGAPLVPYVDWLLFRSDMQARLCLNVGGIANVTLLPREARAEDVAAFDTGPGNMVIDALAFHFTEGRESFDRDGHRAAQGHVDGELLTELMAHDYFARRPPKSAGREQFGEEFTAGLLAAAHRRKLTTAAALATATRLTARSVAEAYRLFILPDTPAAEVLVSGGGVHNRTLLRFLEDEIRLPVHSTAEYGLDPDAKEAVAFALLANETLHGRPGNIPRVTGAERGVVLGSIVPGRGGVSW